MYSIGSVADIISGSNTPNKVKVVVKEVKSTRFKQPNKLNTDVKRKKKIKSKNESNTQMEVPESASKTLSKVSENKARKHKLKNIDASESKKIKAEEPKVSINATNALKRIKRSVKNNSNITGNMKTIFVGNVPVQTTKVEIMKYFSKFGKIESLRFRSAIRADTKISKKVAVIHKKFHPDASSINCYIVFSQKESVDRALSANGVVFNEHHLRIDQVTDTATKHNQKKAIFIGNLPFDAKEEDVWSLFQVCGKIESVRLVRDTRTGVGKGYGYINFDSSDTVELALLMYGVKLGNRELRINRSEFNCESRKKRNEEGKKIRKVPRIFKKASNNVMSNTTFASKTEDYEGIKFTDKKKKKKKNKAELQKKKIVSILMADTRKKLFG